VTDASSSRARTVPNIALNIVIPERAKLASTALRSSCVTTEDDNVPILQTLLPTPNNELMLEMSNSLAAPPTTVEPATTLKHPTTKTNAKTGAEIVLDRVRSLYPDVKRLRTALVSWAHRGRELELTDALINSLLFLDYELALQVIRQLKEPRDRVQSIGYGEIQNRSLVVPLALTSTHNDTELLVNAALVDCGAARMGYMHKDFVQKHGLLTTALPHPIGVYNADGSLNKAGAITDVCKLQMRVGDHVEHMVFRVTDTGSSEVILGLGWLRFHNPLVDWNTGNFVFVRCPPSCGAQFNSWSKTAAAILSTAPGVSTASEESASGQSCAENGPDREHIRAVYDCEYEENDIEAEWFDILTSELKADDESLLCVDMNMRDEVAAANQTDPRVTEYLRETQENATGIDRYLTEFAPVFAKTEFDCLPPRRPWDHAIELKPDAKPIASKIYPLSCTEQDELDKFLEEHLASGRIQTSKSPIASPFFFVKKKDGALRPVQDYRRLNDMTIKNRYPLPLISELMDKLKGAKHFTKLDIRWGYNNVRLKEGDEHKAAFITNRGLFEPLVMFFGLTNSPATFQNMMNDLFRKLILTGHVIIYMDDILIFTDDLTTHRLLTHQVLEILRKNNLCLKPEKCVFEAAEVEYLGVIVSHGQLRMDPKKIEALTDWPKPRNKKDVQQFLGFVNFYRRFIRNFARLAVPLNRLCGMAPWSWTPAEQNAFEALRDAGVRGPVLALPLNDAPFRVEADSSGFATGGVLSQLQDDAWCPVAFYSKSLSDVERNYDIHDRELLSIMRALAEWRRYLHGAPSTFEIFSDHQNLRSL
jgi:hypothetical protein